jgi:hypothetical protein
LNLDWLSPAEVVDARPVIDDRCREIGRDPASLRLSVNIGRPMIEPEGAPRIALLEAYRHAGVDRVMALLPRSATSDEALLNFAADARAAGATLRT